MTTPNSHIESGTPVFRRAQIALFASGFATFSLLYYIQPLLPLFAQDFGVSPAASSLALSLTTIFLAVSMLAASVLSERLGRRKLMLASLLSSALLTVAAAAFPRWGALLVSRALMGITLSGLPAVAMAYVGEEFAPAAIGLAMGLYIGGSAVGGMSGRVVAGLIAGLHGWRVSALAIGIAGLLNAALFWKLLPPSRHFQPRTLNVAAALEGFRAPWRNPVLIRLYAQGFLLMGCFVAVYNYIGFRLLNPPFNLHPSLVGLVSVVYLAGIASPPWMGNLAHHTGYGKVLCVSVSLQLAGVLLLLSSHLWIVVLGLAVMTFGFFGAHSISSSWVTRAAPKGRAQASALYLFTYYSGGAGIGVAGGWIMTGQGWRGLAVTLAAMLLIALLSDLTLINSKPPPDHIPPR